MAADFGVSKSAVSQWRTGGAPTRCMRRIVEMTAGAVTLDDLLLDKEGAGQPAPNGSASLPPSAELATVEAGHAG